jgi:hypothetical protein
MSATSIRAVHATPDASGRSMRSPVARGALTRDPSGRGLLVLLALLAVYVPTYLVYFTSGAPFSLAHATAACGGRPVLDTRWTYDATQAHEYLTSCGVTGRAAVQHQQLADLVYVALYAGVLLAAYAYLIRAGRLTGRAWRLTLALPLIVAGFDYLENAGIWTLLIRYPDAGVLTDRLALVTATKLGLGYLSLCVLAALAVSALGNRLGRGRQSTREERS